MAVVAGLALGGRVGNLARLELRAPWLFFSAIGLQVIAFPVGFMPWRTGTTAASALWLASFVLLILAAVLNRRIAGVPLVAGWPSAALARRSNCSLSDFVATRD